MIISEIDIKVLSETGLSIQVSESLLTDVGICGTPPPKRSLREETHFSIRNCYDEIVQGALYHGEESSYGGLSSWTSLVVVAKIQLETLTSLNLNAI